MTKCTRCNSTILQPETCGLCGEPYGYIRYHPEEIPGVKRLSTPHHSRMGVPRYKGDSAFVDSPTLLKDIRKFCGRHSFPPTVFGKQFFNDANLIERLQNGAVPRKSTVLRIRESMRLYEAGEGVRHLAA